MKLKTPKPDANFWIIAGTLTFFILSYFIYLKSYVPNQESKIISTRFRVLDQMGDNINAKIKSYNDNVISLANKIQDTVNGLKNRFETYGYLFPEEQIVPYILKGFKEGKYQDFLNKDLKVIDYKLDKGGAGYPNNAVTPQGSELEKSETDNFYYFKPIAIKTVSTVHDTTETYNDSVLVRVSYQNILNGLTRNDVFDGMFIIRNGEFIFSTLNSDMLIQKVSGYQGLFELLFTNQELPKPAEGAELSKSGPEFSLPQRIVSGKYSDITISNKDYKLFFKPIKVEEEYWFLAGLMEVPNFNVAGRSIPQRVIIILSLFLILIVLGVPLIKLKVISKTEHLKTGSIINSALAILFGSSVITLFLLYVSQDLSRIQNSDRQLIKFSSTIESSFTEEIDSAYRQLKKTDHAYERFNFGINSPGHRDQIISNILNLGKDNLAFPSIYPFADYIFWADKKGLQSASLSPFIGKTPMTNVGTREYYNKKDEWFFPLDSTKKFRLESILSNTSGDHKAAISTISDSSNNPVVAITSQFYSLINPIIPKNFGFCIIDESGKVWFHSDKYRNLMENFLDECNDNANLKAAIYNRTATPIPVTYYNTPHRAFIQPLKQLPLFLVTFYNWDTEISFHAQVFTMTFIFIILFFIFIFIQVSLIMMLERRYQWKLSKNLIMKITRPLLHLDQHHRFLFLVYILVIIVTAIWMHFLGKIQSFATIYMVEIIIFVFSYRVLNDNELKVNQTKRFTRINFIILIIMNLGLFMLVGIVDELMLLGYQLLLIFLLEKSYRSFKRKLKKPGFAINKDFVKDYVLFLLAMTILFAVLPTMAFYEIAYNNESEIRVRHYQVDLMKKREIRNARWNTYYAPMMASGTVTDILQDRKNKGIYTDFLDDLTFAQEPIPPAEMEKNIIHGSVLDSLSLLLRPFYDDEIVENKYLLFGNKNNSGKSWIDYGGGELVLKYLSNTEDPKFAKQEYMRIEGKVKKISFLAPYHINSFTDLKDFFNNSVFWLIMLLVFFAFYHIIRFGVRNIFSLDILAKFSHEPFGKMISNQILASKGIFIVRPSQKDETHAWADSMQIDLRLDWSDKEIITESENLVDKCLADRKKNDFVTIFIDHFEWAYPEADILDKKLETLMKYINRRDIHLIIQSYENPAKIIAHYRKSNDPGQNTTEEENNTGNAGPALHKKILNDLQRLMDHTIINPLPVKCSYSAEEEEDPCGKPVKKMDLEGLIEEELGAADYLGQFKETVTAYYESNIKGRDRENPEELIVDRINTLADSYYEDLLNSCPPEEQYIIIDLADDLIINQKSSKAIFGLLEKGILVKKCDKINFMNISFRRFVISQKGRIDTADLEIKIGKKAGTWHGYRIMFILIIASLFIFIAIANQDFMKNLNQIFVVLGGGIATITGVLGLLSKNNKPAS
jgi:hypothetical protein